MKSDFALWLKDNTEYQPRVQSDIVSRVKRADGILPLPQISDMYYLFRLQQEDNYKALSTSVRSQLKKAITIYFAYLDTK